VPAIQFVQQYQKIMFSCKALKSPDTPSFEISVLKLAKSVETLMFIDGSRGCMDRIR